MIKITLRKNLLYLLVLYVTYILRTIISMIIKNVFNFSDPYIFLFVMALGIFIGGLTLYLYHIISFKSKKGAKYFKLDLIYNKINYKAKDGIVKKIILIFLAAFFDFYEFILISFYIPSILEITPAFNSKLGGLSTISSSLICIYALRFKIGKHHKFSMIGLSICLCLTLIIEIIFKSEDESIDRLLFGHFLLCLYLINLTFTDCTERYLVDFNFLNPFFILMIEGIFEFIFATFYSLNNDPFKEILNQYEHNSTGKFILFIFLLFIYFLLTALVNVYKIYCNCFYTPMAKSFVDYFFNPFLNIYYFISGKDFINNFFYFFMSEIVCILADFFCCIYNEFIIVSFCGLEYDTKDEISKRALEIGLNTIIDEDDPNDHDTINSNENNN